MKYYKFSLLPVLVIASAVIFSSCSDSNPLSPNSDDELGNQVSSANNSVTLSMLAPVNNNSGSKAKNGSATLAVDDITISEVKMLVNELELESTEDDSLDFEANNLVVELPLDGSPFIISSQSVPVGIYKELEVEIDKPDENSNVGDADFDDGEKRYSIVIRGTKDGNDFTLKSQEDFDYELEFEPPIEITDSTSSVEIDVMVDVDRWFRDGLNGRTLDPSNSDDIERIEENIEDSFETRRRIRNNEDDRDENRDEKRDYKRFKQPVKSVDLSSNTFTIASGLTVQITDSTTIDQDGDLLSLMQVERALNNNIRVKSEGLVKRTGENSDIDFIAIRLKFETKEDDDEDENGEFEQIVESVDLERNTFTTRNGFIVQITDNTVINRDGDLLLLREVHNAMEQNIKVKVEGQVRRAVSDPNIDFIAVRIKFETDNDSDDNEFERKVKTVDLESNTFTTRGGIVVGITENSRISDDGDLGTLRAVSNAIDNNKIVKVEGRLQRAVNNPDVDFTAIRLKFEIEDDDKNGDGEFERLVRSVDIPNNRFTTTVGSTVQITDDTVISQTGDLVTLQEVSDALAEEKKVEVEGRVRRAPNNGDVDFIAKRLKFQTGENNEDQGQDENDDEDEDSNDDD